MRPSLRRLEITVLSLCLCLVHSDSGNAVKCFTAHRPEETICCLHAQSICCSLFYHLWLEAGGDFFINFRCCVYGQTGLVQISVVFLSLSSKTNACTRQDLHDRKQYHFVHMQRYNPQKRKVPLRGFKAST